MPSLFLYYLRGETRHAVPTGARLVYRSFLAIFPGKDLCIRDTKNLAVLKRFSVKEESSDAESSRGWQ